MGVDNFGGNMCDLDQFFFDVDAQHGVEIGGAIQQDGLDYAFVK